MTEQFGWEYQNTWRASPRLLWGISVVAWVLGVFLEEKLPGSIATSGGLVIAITTPLFGYVFAKQRAYELDMKLAIINLKRENNFGLSVSVNPNLPNKEEILGIIESNVTQIENFDDNYAQHLDFSRKLLLSQSCIVGLSSAIWSTGEWAGNIFWRCGSPACG